MNTTHLNTEQINILLSLANADPKTFFQDLLTSYEISCLDNLQKIKIACDSKNDSDLRMAIHQINGSSSNIGLSALSALCYDIEDQIHKNIFNEYNSLHKQLEAKYNNSKIELLAYLDSLKI